MGSKQLSSRKNGKCRPQDKAKNKQKSKTLAKESKSKSLAKESKPKTKTKKISTPAVLECDICHKQFTHRGMLNRHIITHSGAKPFQCSECDKTFTRKHHLHNHQFLHMSLEERTKFRKHVCKECGKVFSRKEYLDQHSHSEDKKQNYKCVQCDKSFVQKSGLTRHMALHGEKKLKCEVCNKAFARSDTLNEHLQSHINMRDFACPECGKSFNTKSYLQKHLLSHYQIRDFSCVECGKAFLHKSDLNRHELMHQRKEKELRCADEKSVQKSSCSEKCNSLELARDEEISNEDESELFETFSNGSKVDDTDGGIFQIQKHSGDDDDASASNRMPKKSLLHRYFLNL